MYMNNRLLCHSFLGTALLCAATFAPLQAQSSMSSTMAPAASGTPVAPAKVFGDLFKSESEEILSAAEAMPADKYDFVPPASYGTFDGVRSFGAQVDHLAAANYGFLGAFGVPGGKTRAELSGLKTKEELVQALEDSFVYADKVVATMTAQNAFQPIMMGKQTATRAGLAAGCLAHANDHYGQMVEYLRMNGIIPPASVKK
jgi:uncharacterized damage-inducible protein DinB